MRFPSCRLAFFIYSPSPSSHSQPRLLLHRSVLQAVFLPLRFDETSPSGYPGYEAVKGRLLRAPILRAFADARAPKEVRDWVQSIGAMAPFDRILTSHFASPIKATPAEYASALEATCERTLLRTLGGALDALLLLMEPTLLRTLGGALDEPRALVLLMDRSVPSSILARYTAAFDYLQGPTTEPPIGCADWQLLDGLNDLIGTQKLGAPVVYDFKQGCK